MTKLKRILMIIVGAVVTLQLLANGHCVQAASAGDTSYVERAEKGFYTIQSWNGSEWMYVTYSITNYVDEYGTKRVAYCVNPDRKGIGYISGEFSGYDVEVKNIINDEKAWRVLTNGYPYKPLSEIGVTNEQDAYLATKMALYAMIRGNTSDDIRRMYRPGEDKVAGQSLEEIKTRGTAVIEAICRLVDIGNSGNKKMQFENCVSVTKDGAFVVYPKDEKYNYQKIKVSSEAECEEYNVTKVDGLPKEAKIADINGIEKTTFKGGDEFIIMVPKTAIIENLKISVEVSAKLKNYPIYYAECKEGNYQNYYLCCDECSRDNKATCSIDIDAYKSKLSIQKIDKDSKEPIANVEFSVKYVNGKEIGTYTTDENGEIHIENLHQGQVSVKELKCDEKYKLDSDEKIIDVGYAEELSVVVENELKEVPEEEHEEVQKLPRTGDFNINAVLFVCASVCGIALKKSFK